MESVGLKEGEKVICLTKGKGNPNSDVECGIIALTIRDVTRVEYVKGEGKNTYVYFKEFNDFYYASQRENVFTKSQLSELLE